MEVFGIGMVVVAAMLLHSPRRYFFSKHSNEHPTCFDYSQLQKDLRELNDIYPPTLIELITEMCQPQPESRSSLTEIKDKISKIRDEISMGGSLRMCEDE